MRARATVTLVRLPPLILACALGLTACGISSDSGAEPPALPPAQTLPEAAPAVPPAPTNEPPSAAAPEPSEEPPSAEPDAPPEPGGLDSIELEVVAVLGNPLDLAVRPGEDNLYVAEKGGRLNVITPEGAVAAELFLDLSDRVSTESERGLLGIAFSPDGSRLYAHYSDRAGAGHLASWAVTDQGLDLTSEIDHLVVSQPFSNHNGGRIAFGPDGFLYWALGDGGSGGDPEGNGQDPSTLLGSILRIEPLTEGDATYRVPDDNPFVGDPDARDEIWVWGLRNPWKFSFDADGGLWIGDVGQNELEEIDYLPAGSAAGANLGWNALEGTAPFAGDAPDDAVPPVFEYDHDTGVSITGGFVYRGEAIPALRGRYVFGDFLAGFVATLTLEDGEWRAEQLPIDVPQLASFGEDSAGELYALNLSGTVYRLVAG